MATPGVNDAARLLTNFQFLDPAWAGAAFVPSWGRELEIYVYPDEEGITARQLAVVRALLVYTRDLRPAFEDALFEYYKTNVEGSWCEYGPGGVPIPNSGPPVITAPAQVWSLIDIPDIYVPDTFRTFEAIEFELSFNCEWDPEHGLGVRYKNWEPAEFGGWGL